MKNKQKRKERCTCGTLFDWDKFICMEKEKIGKFYKQFFNRDIDWSKVNINSNVSTMKYFKLFRPEYIFSDIKADEVVDTYSKQFGGNSIFVSSEKYDGRICSNIKSQQERPKKDYVVFHKGEIVPDLLGWSYQDGIDQRIDFMVVVEGIISEFRFRVETGEVYDNYENATCFSTIDRLGSPMAMKWVRGYSHLGIFEGNQYDKDFGLRRVFYEKPYPLCNL